MIRTSLPCLLAAVTFASLAACGSASNTGAPADAQAPAAKSATTASAAPASASFTGTVAETMNSGGYTYAKLQSAGKDDMWIAGNEFKVTAGERLTVALEMPMQNFESKTLKRTFPLIYFVANVVRDGETPAAASAQPPAMMTSHTPSAAAAAPLPVEPVAPAPGGLSVADVWAKRASLSGKEITVRGRVVKVNEGILDRNWIHLQDGTGSAADRTNDLTVTTSATVKVGDVVTVTGVLATGKDFGAGYAYDAILENGTIK
jgi:uncharacterized cupredoxin-like copper-binding protein